MARHDPHRPPDAPALPMVPRRADETLHAELQAERMARLDARVAHHRHLALLVILLTLVAACHRALTDWSLDFGWAGSVALGLHHALGVGAAGLVILSLLPTVDRAWQRVTSWWRS